MGRWWLYPHHPPSLLSILSAALCCLGSGLWDHFPQVHRDYTMATIIHQDGPLPWPHPPIPQHLCEPWRACNGEQADPLIGVKRTGVHHTGKWMRQAGERAQSSRRGNGGWELPWKGLGQLNEDNVRGCMGAGASGGGSM